jgi:hypothetical protein
VTGLTGALDQLDRCMPFVGFSSCEHLGEFPIVVCFCWSVHGRLRVLVLEVLSAGFS